MNWGPGDRQTFPGIITTSGDPDYEQWEDECPDCDGTGSVDDEEDYEGISLMECPACEGTGVITVDNVGERRR